MGIPTKAQAVASLRHNARARERRTRRLVEVAARIAAHKKALGCRYCGEADPSCLDVRIEDPTSKVLPVAQLIRRKLDPSALQRALDGCVVVCSNCHSKHYQQLREFGAPASSAECDQLASPVARKERLPSERRPGFDETLAELRQKCFP